MEAFVYHHTQCKHVSKLIIEYLTIHKNTVLQNCHMLHDQMKIRTLVEKKVKQKYLMRQIMTFI
jgi:hypothetical protein